MKGKEDLLRVEKEGMIDEIDGSRACFGSPFTQGIEGNSRFSIQFTRRWMKGKRVKKK